MAHALAGAYDRLLVPASWIPRLLRPYGSHPKTDPLFSSSSVQFVHYQHDWARKYKTKFLTDYPVALDHLRVCWKSESGDNCHRCYKCLRTMATLDVYDALQRSQAFQPD